MFGRSRRSQRPCFSPWPSPHDDDVPVGSFCRGIPPLLRRDVGPSLSGSSFDRYREKEIHMPYVDGFVIPVAKDKVEAYKAQARKAGEVFKEYGALSFVECIGDDVPYGKLTSFPRAVQASDDEIVMFSWIVYRSRAERDAISEKVMADPRLQGEMPFDARRMIFGGFEAWLEM
jgi:uncharacterized protein YbaA (DUF1428 family)